MQLEAKKQAIIAISATYVIVQGKVEEHSILHRKGV